MYDALHFIGKSIQKVLITMLTGFTKHFCQLYGNSVCKNIDQENLILLIFVC